MDRFYKYFTIPRDLGLPVAFATQDGLPITSVPWDRFDTLFIGGSDNHKRIESLPIISTAISMGKHIHIGRVSSISAILKYWPKADSVDGSTFIFSPDVKERKLIPELCRMKNYEHT